MRDYPQVATAIRRIMQHIRRWKRRALSGMRDVIVSDALKGTMGVPADLLLVAFESWASLTNPLGKIGRLIRGVTGGINQSTALEFRERQITG
jgi:hypothetical protein